MADAFDEILAADPTLGVLDASLRAETARLGAEGLSPMMVPERDDTKRIIDQDEDVLTIAVRGFVVDGILTVQIYFRSTEKGVGMPFPDFARQAVWIAQRTRRLEERFRAAS